MNQETTKITCPKCGNEFNVEEVISHQIEEKYRDQLNKKITDIQNEYKKKESNLAQREVELKQREEQSDKLIEIKLKEETEKRTKAIKEQVKQEYESQLKILSDEASEQRKQVQELKKAQIENEQLKRKLDVQKQSMELEFEQKLTEKLKEESLRIKKTESERNELKIKESSDLIETLKNQIKDLERRAEQGSMQRQGETQELAIEQYLKDNFPLDTIEEIKKGARGADCTQTINTQSKQGIGIIYYESKRTKDFQTSWMEKFKADMREKGADVGILVTEAFPKDMERMGQKEGIWVCSYSEFKGLCFVVREFLIRVKSALTSQENKTDKMSMLYDFLTSNEFKQEVEAIVEGFTQMNVDLQKEKTAMEGLWKRREKQIQKVLLNTTSMFNSIKGIAGKEIGSIKLLELPVPKSEI